MKENSGIVYVTADEMRQIDELTIREFQIDVLILMENAGIAVATLAKRMLNGTVTGRRVACLAGGGNNGGDALVAARHLANWGYDVEVILGTSKEKIKDTPLGQLRILERMGVPVVSGDHDFRKYDLLVAGLIGYGLEGHPRGRVAEIIAGANSSGRPILAVDLPSGMNATTGEIYDPCIKATSTVTLCLPKTAFLAPGISSHVGELYLADISVPRQVYRQFGQETELFQKDTLVMI